MKICPNCGTSNRDEASACSNCLVLLNNQDQNLEVNNQIEQFNDPNKQFNEQNQQFNPGNLQQNARPAKCKKSKKIWAFSIAGILGVVAIVLALNVMGMFMSPGEKIAASLRKNLLLKNINGSFKISVKGTPSDDFPKGLNKLSLNGYLSNDGGKSYSEFAINMNNTDLLNCTISQDDKDLFFAIGEKALWINVDKILKSNPDTASYSNLMKYVSKIDINKVFSEKYDKVIAETIEGRIIKSNGKYIISLNANDIFTIANEIVDTASKDENLYNEFYDILKGIDANAKKDKVDLGSDFNDMMAKPKQTVILEMKKMVGICKIGIKNYKKQILNYLPADLKCQFIIDIGLMNKVKTVDMSVGTKDFKVVINIDNTKSVKRKSFDKKTSVIIEDVEKDADKITDYFTNALIEIISNDKAIAEIDKEGLLDGIEGFGDMDTKDLTKFIKENIIKDLKDKVKNPSKDEIEPDFDFNDLDLDFNF